MRNNAPEDDPGALFFLLCYTAAILSDVVKGAVMEQRYVIRFRTRRVNRVPYPVAKVWRLFDETMYYEAWGKPMGAGTAEADHVRKLLEAVPDDQAEAVVAQFKEDRLREALDVMASILDKRRRSEE